MRKIAINLKFGFMANEERKAKLLFSYAKKILSCILVLVMLLTTVRVSFSVFAQDTCVNLELNGGTLNCVTSNYAPGDVLPESGQVIRENATFAGWYTDSDFSGERVYIVPTDVVGNITYYARWVICDVNFENFDSYSTADDMMDQWTNWTDPISNATIALNTDSNHALSGSNSLKFTVNKANASASVKSEKANFSQLGDGVAFWIESTSDATVKIKFNGLSDGIFKEVTVPAGEQIVTIPWSEIPGALDKANLWRTNIIVTAPRVGDVVYIDDIGTYSDKVDYNLNLNTNGGSWVEGYTAPTKCEANMPLPTMDNIKRDGSFFAGWYDNVERTGTAITSLPSDISADKEYWAKWVNLYADVENFEAYSTADDILSEWTNWTDDKNATISLNTDANHAFGGNNSFKISYIKANKNASVLKDLDFSKLGDGFAFWIESTSGATVQIKLNNGTFVSQSITVPAGKQIFTIPWNDIPSTSDTTLLWRTNIIVSAPNVGDVVYIDDIGTYSQPLDYSISFNTNGGSWIENFTPPTGYYVSSELLLPDYNQLKKEGVSFAGWYDNKELTGLPIYSVSVGTKGDKNYWAKWVILESNFDNFDSYSTPDDMQVRWTNWTSPPENADITLNTDPNYALSGKKSFKITFNKDNATANILNQKVDFLEENDGIAFWIETTNGATVKIRFNANENLQTNTITVSAGKQFVSIPWSSIPGIFDPDYLWRTQFFVSAPKANDVVYIDDIGTYSNILDYGVTFNTNGGSWVEGYTAAQKCYATMLLPTMDNIERDGLEFVGWFDNPEFIGSPVTTVCDDISDDKEYWAKWIAVDTNFDKFDSYSTTDDMMTNNWTNWTSPVTNATVELNTDANHALSGNNSLKFTVNKANAKVNLMRQFNYSKTDDGVAFWIESTREAKIIIRFNGKDSLQSEEITVPAGKQMVTIPWSYVPDALNQSYLWQTNIIVSALNVGDVVYIDDIGTYSQHVDYNITFNTNGGSWINNYTPPTGYFVSNKLFLPNCNQLKKDGLTFAGWYDNEALTGSPIYFVDENATGNKQYWAKWILHDVNFENFESYDTNEDLFNANHWMDSKSQSSLNTNSAHAYNGGKSIKIQIEEANVATTIVNRGNTFSKTGDGVAFWIETRKGASIRIKFNNNDALQSQEITFSEGKRIVTIPWSQIPDVLNQESLWMISISVSTPRVNDVVYIDEIGTYTEDTSIANNITYYTIDTVWGENYIAPTKFETTGVLLPTQENILMPGYIFAGWYDNKDLDGEALTVIPESGDISLYAKRIKRATNYDNFEYQSNDSDWVLQSDGATLVLDSNPINAYSGSNSLKISIEDYESSENRYAVASKNGVYNKTDDGVYFWIKSEANTQVLVAFDDIANSYILNVGAGKNFIAIPWERFAGLNNKDVFEQMFIQVSSTKNGNTVYIDDIGTYSSCMDSKLTFHTNGGNWAQGYVAPQKYDAHGVVLPTEDNISKDRIIFAGWYDNKEFKGQPIKALAPDSTGNKEFWAKWIVNSSVYDDFDSYTANSDVTKKWYKKSSSSNLEITLNTDSAHAKGGKSMKIRLKNADVVDYSYNTSSKFPQTGDGVSFWLESPNGVTVSVGFNGSSDIKSQNIFVPAGEQIVTIPWSQIEGALENSALTRTSLYISTPNANDVIYIDEIGTYKEFDANHIMAKWENGFTYSLNDENEIVWNLSKTAGTEEYVGFATDYVLRKDKDYVITFDYKYLTNGVLARALQPRTVGNSFDETLIKNQTEESNQTLNSEDINGDWETMKVAYSASKVTEDNKYLAFFGKTSPGANYDISLKNLCFYDLGDVDFSGIINSLDLSLLRSDLLGVANTAEFTDVNNDGKTDIIDLVRLKKLCVEYNANENPLKRGVNLTGFESGLNYGYDRWIFQPEYYDIIKEKGFDHVRLPVDFFKYMGSAPEYKIDKEFLAKIDLIVDIALNSELKIVLDFHHFGEMQTNVKGNKQKFYKMWQQLAEHYQNYPNELIFELFNEPGNGDAIRGGGPDVITSEKLLEIQDEAIKIIRKTNPTRYIVHATSWNNSAIHLMATEPFLPDDENIIVAVHSYEPMIFTHQGADWDADGEFYPATDFTDDMKAEIEEVFKCVKEYQEIYRRPVWIGEFGVYNTITPDGARAKYADFIVDVMKDAKCGWNWWSFQGTFGIYDTTAGDWVDESLIAALMK